MDCIFCQLAAKKLPAEILFENDKVLAFRDLAPKAPHHILIIPKVHVASLNEVTEEDGEMLGDLMFAASILAKELGIAEDGYRCVINTNSDGGQTVFHLHLHLMAGRAFTWPPG